MGATALDVNYAAGNRRSQMRSRNPSQAKPRPRGQVIDASSRFTSNRTRKQAGRNPSISADVIPLNAARIPDKKNATKEQAHKRKMASNRHMDKMRAQHFGLPKELDDYSSDLTGGEMDQVKGWYGDELRGMGMDRLLEKQQAGGQGLVRNAVNRKIEKLKEQAKEKVKKKAKEAFKKALKKTFASGTKKTVWSAIDQGAVVEVEGVAIETWFSSGALLTSYQGLTGALHGGKPFIPEGTVISWLEPPPLSHPSGKAPQNAAESLGMMIQLYDLFMWLLIPIYWFAVVAVILLMHLAVAYTTFMVLMPIVGFAYLLSLVT
jgi:hypothetical protein